MYHYKQTEMKVVCVVCQYTENAEISFSQEDMAITRIKMIRDIFIDNLVETCP